MTTSVNIHHATTAKANPGGTLGAPLIIDFLDHDGRHVADVTIFLHDFPLAASLADAINGAVEAHKADEKEAA